MNGRILVTEDDRNLRRVLKAMLDREGYEVAEAPNGVAALEWLAAHRADVVISDIRMPKMDGLALFRKLRDLRPGLPVILITAYGTIGDAVEAIRAGAFDYISKSFSGWWETPSGRRRFRIGRAPGRAKGTSGSAWWDGPPPGSRYGRRWRRRPRPPCR